MHGAYNEIENVFLHGNVENTNRLMARDLHSHILCSTKRRDEKGLIKSTICRNI